MKTWFIFYKSTNGWVFFTDTKAKTAADAIYKHRSSLEKHSSIYRAFSLQRLPWAR
jgi:hypothetical protein